MIFHFSIAQVHFIFCELNFIAKFTCLIKYTSVLCLLILYFDYIVIGRHDYFFRSRFTSRLSSYSVSLSYLIFDVPMRDCLENTRA